MDCNFSNKVAVELNQHNWNRDKRLKKSGETTLTPSIHESKGTTGIVLLCVSASTHLTNEATVNQFFKKLKRN